MIIKRIDELGRIVLPIHYRKSMQICEGDELEMFFENDSIIIRKNIPLCKICASDTEIDPDVHICRKCLDKILLSVKNTITEDQV